ncbi:MAG: glycerol-3-phosphate dehydrogenase/oxidase [Deltaproteobacteria bacterium]|nr:MAG: glycerol-3-phosphate dehydrogenase/oxidase [Deltaproteobacteria bacterium]
MTPRSAALARLGSETFDLLVIGGGINGAGIARDGAMRGLRTALVEHADFASGTSSRSSKLIHGGFRYLEQGDVRLVLEACRERERLRRLAPHLVRPQEFIFPVYEGGPVGRFKLAAGLWAYDLMAGLWNVHRHRMLSARATRQAEPALRTEGLRGAGRYWDCRTDDARLVLETILAAVREGGVAVSYARVTALLKENGRIAGARLVDRLGGGEVSVRARVVVNATGPWVDAVAVLDAPAPPRLRLTKGVHVLVPRARVGNRAAVVLHAVKDGRVMFVIPWKEQTLVGTTDTDHEGGPDVPAVVEAADVSYLLETVNHYFPAARLSRADVTSAFAGLRPLIAPPAGAAVAPSSVSREEEIFASPSGLISIAGGKLTTHRLVAAAVVERVIDALRRGGERRRFGRSRTGTVPLPGGTAPPDSVAAAVLSHDGNGLAPPVIGHLADRYGSRVGELLHRVAADRRLADPIVPTLPDPRAEVLEAVEHEGALTVEDVLRRRTQISLREESEGVKAAGEVAALMAGPLGWTPEAARAAAESYAAVVEEGRRRWR